MAVNEPHNAEKIIISLPQDVETLLRALHAAGFAAFAVGGCVRDSLLGKIPHDWDVATAATPSQIKEIFAEHRLLLQGEKHGTVAVDTGARWVEVTTFRTESGYTDARHPDAVQFVSDIQSDLLRRDFTVNALAYAPQTGLVNVCGGVADLHGGILRTVGDADARFGEDALRILRCVRFAAQLQFSVAKETEASLRQNAVLLPRLAKERIGQEVQALLRCEVCGCVAAQYADVLAIALCGAVREDTQKMLCAMDTVHQTPLWAWRAKAENVSWQEARFLVRCALLCAGLGVEPQQLVAFGFGKRQMRQVQCIVTAEMPQTADVVAVRLFLHGVSIENAALCFAYHAAINEQKILAETEKTACEIVMRGDALQMAQLCITGEDAAVCGLRGKEIGLAMTQALENVLCGKLENKRQTLCGFLREYKEKLRK